MIYTVTFNPSLDYAAAVEHFRPGAVNRTVWEDLRPGGKGVNVSVVLRALGLESVALGFTAGFTGREIERILTEWKIRHDFVPVQGFSRINVKLLSDLESEINGRGPEISAQALQALTQKLDALRPGDVLVLSGSVPACLPDDMYERILERISERGVLCAVDAEGAQLRKTLKFRPFLIKPNGRELAGLFARRELSEREIAECAAALQREGARNVLVSLGGEGAMLLAEDGRCLRGRAPRGRAVNTVGAGDSMVAGFLAGMLRDGDVSAALRLGLAAGSASAFSRELATQARIRELLGSVEIGAYRG